MLNNIDQITSLLAQQVVIPIVETDDLTAAERIAELLSRSGLPVIEVVMRSSRAADVIKLLRTRVPHLVVGAGTVTNADKLLAARAAGAQFVVTPGVTPKLLDLLETCALPVIPGVATVSEALSATERGAGVLKVFPAAALGGARFIEQLASVLGDKMFIPTGGINADSASDYLSLPAVLAVGGSWMCPRSLVTAQSWTDIDQRALEAGRLSGRQQ